MFSFRRRPKQQDSGLNLRLSPSLPLLGHDNHGIGPWPENLVDVAAVQQAATQAQEEEQQQQQHKQAKGSFHLNAARATVPFHLPFREAQAGQHHVHYRTTTMVMAVKPRERMEIASLYMPPTGAGATSAQRVMTPASRHTTYTQRRTRVSPTFNIMVAGGKGTGKTSLARLLLESADISPGATRDQRLALDRFLRGKRPKVTRNIEMVCVEISESRFERILFSVVDTPGLDFAQGRELKLERQVGAIVKYVDAQYADTMNEESKVVRQSKEDQHIHLCIYVIDPSSVMTMSERNALSSLPFHSRTETDLSNDIPGDEDDNEEEALTMSPAEIRVIHRLSARCNVLPIVGHADSLTDAKLEAVKQAVRESMTGARLNFALFDISKGTSSPSQNGQCHSNANGYGHPAGEHGELNGNGNGQADEDEPEERKSRPVVKLRTPRRANGTARSRSRGRRDLAVVAAEEDHRPISPESGDRDSIPNVRFSAAVLAKTDLTQILPFAVMAAETCRNGERPGSTDTQLLDTAPTTPVPPDEDRTPLTPVTPYTPITALAYRHGPPDELKGVFTRKFRWGTLDVLDPKHCDFAALRTVVLTTHLKLFKTHTKEVLYEKYRTEKLLARRATQNIPEEDRQRLLEDLGL